MYNNRCDKCGAYLDPSEHCDCEEEERREREREEKKFVVEENGQLKFRLSHKTIVVL